MQVRDLIKELERFEPTAEVRANVYIKGTFGGAPWTSEDPAEVLNVEIERGEPVLFIKCS